MSAVRDELALDKLVHEPGRLAVLTVLSSVSDADFLFLQRATGLTPNNARALLGQFLFSGEEAEKPLDGLSGGERRRLSLAILVHSGANVLILDEPTNHLDLESREALEEAARREGRPVKEHRDRSVSFYTRGVGGRAVEVIYYPPDYKSSDE